MLAEDLPLAPGATGGQVEYRRSLASSFFFKFYLTVSEQLSTEEVHFEFYNKKIGVLIGLVGDMILLRLLTVKGRFSSSPQRKECKTFWPWPGFTLKHFNLFVLMIVLDQRGTVIVSVFSDNTTVRTSGIEPETLNPKSSSYYFATAATAIGQLVL